MPGALKTPALSLEAVRTNGRALEFVPVRHRDGVKTAVEQETELDAEPEDTEPETDGPRP